nr:autotransporter outer membrane beta-barrel domain-containing protein [Sutterella megalosphaeroides]
MAAVAAAALSSGIEAATWDTGYDVILNEEHDEGTTHVGSGFAFGNKNLDLAAKTYDEDLTVLSWAFDPYVFRFNGLDSSGTPTVKLNLDDPYAMSVFEQSRGFDQALVHVKGGLTVHSGAHFSVDTGNSDPLDSNIFEQLIEQNGKTVARGRYIIGTRAQNLKALDGKTWDGYHDGIMFTDTTFYTATVLSELEIYDGQTLKLNVSGSQNWGAHLTGEGDVAYVGDNKAEDVVTVKQNFESHKTEDQELDRLHLANDYTGATTVKGVTLNLERETSLGSSGILNATDANIVEVNEGALGELDTIDFTNTALTTAGTSLEVTGDATFAGQNTINVVGSFEVDNGAELTSGSLTTGLATFKAGALEISDAALTASSVTVTGNTTVSGANTVTAGTFSANSLLLNANGSLHATGDLTANTARLAAGTQLVADKNVAVNDLLVMHDSAINAARFDAWGSVSLSGANTISTTDGAFIRGGDVALANGVSLDVARGGLTASTSVTVDDDAKLTVTGELNVEHTLTLGTAGSKTDTSNFSVGGLKVGEELAFVGKGRTSDDVYKFGTLVSALNSESAYNVSLTNANVEYTSWLRNVGTTTLDQAHLTLAYDNAVSLGHVVMTNTSGSAKSQNLLTFKSDWGFVIDNRFSVEGSAPEDVIELSGKGEVAFADTVQVDDNYAGWIRMTGTTLHLPQANMQGLSEKLSVSVGTGGTIALSNDQTTRLNRLGWADTGKNPGGTIDLSKFDFSNLGSDKAAITVNDLTVNGNGTIVVDESAVQGLTVGTGDEGDSIFDALNGNGGTLVISVANGFDPEAAGGTINVIVDGDTDHDEQLTGYFGDSGLFIGDNAVGAAAKGTWGYGTELDGSGLHVTHKLNEIELLEGKTLELAVEGSEYQGVQPKLTGTGTLKKTGDGFLHLVNTENTWSGSTVVEGGCLIAEAGALGTGMLDVDAKGTFVLSGAQDEKSDQIVEKLAVDGVVKIGGNTTENHLTLEVAEGGYFAEGSVLEGGSDTTLALNGGTLRVTDIEDVTSGYQGEIRVGGEATLVLDGNKDGRDDVADLSHVTGLGTIVLKDYAKHDTTGNFNGTTKVAGGHLEINGENADSTSGANLVMTEEGGTIESKGEHVFNSIDLRGGVLNVGKVTAGADIASGALHGTNVNLSDVTIEVSTDASGLTVDASDILSIDNVEGKTTWLVEGDKVEVANVTITGLDNVDKDPDLMQDGEQIGTIHYTLGQVTTDKGVGFNTKADSLTLTGVLNLTGSPDPTADTTLDLSVTGSETSGIKVEKEIVTLAGRNSYGTLDVEKDAEVILKNDQILAAGGTVNGRVSGDGQLVVKGGTLAVSSYAGTDFGIVLDAETEGENAELLIADRVGSPDLFAGAVRAEKGAVVSFWESTGNFTLASGSADYVLENRSSVTFGPYTPAEDGSFEADTVSVDNSSSAYFDIQGKAGATDLSQISGDGRVVLSYAPASEAVGTLDVTAIGTDSSAFTGTLAFVNAQATIGTDVSVANSALTQFATSTGKLEVGEGSVLHINNAKIRGGDGTVTPNPVKLAGDFSISDRATLDFTAGVLPGSGDEYLGNTSGVSVNAIDMQGHGFDVVGTGAEHTVTVVANVDNLDFASGLPSGGTYHGSILDMLGDTPDYPVLTLIKNIGETSDLAKIASEMKLEGDNVEHVVEFWQPNWDPNVDKTVHVANVTTGVKLVADEAHNGIAIGAGITGIDIVSGATLRMDEAASTESGVHVVDAEIKGDGNVIVSNSLGTAGSDGITFAAGNTYTGETVIDLGATLTAANEDAFGGSSLVRVGTMENGDGTDSAPSTLKVSVSQGNTGTYTNALKVNALTVGSNGTVELAKDNDLLLTGTGTSTLAANSTVTGDDSTTIGLAGGKLVVEKLDTLSGFKGAFRVDTDASVDFTVADGSYTWTNDVLYYTDARSRAIGAGEFVKTGAGTLVIDGTQANLAAMRLVAAEGTTNVKGGASILGLTTRADTVVDVDGVFTTQSLSADAGSIFALDVVTGKTVSVKEGESSTTKPIWGLGENGSDGIRVTGTASGTLNLAVTPKNVDRGAEESIQLVDAAHAEDGNFTVNLVDANGSRIEALTAGAYDYTLVRKDDAQNGTDVFLSSITGEDDVRNTTVTAGSYLGVAAAAQLFDISLHDRMSNRSWLTANADGSIANSFWVLETVSNERYGDSTGQIDVHDTASTTTVGSDILSGLAAGGTWYAGAMFSYATEDTKSRSNRTALDSRADTDAWAAGLYAGWQLNGADRTGPYVDGWILWTDAESDVKGGNVSETVDGNGLSASIEAGWGFKALSYNAHGQAGDIYVEPHVSVTWFGYEADDVSNDVHDVTFEGKDNIRTKLGVKTYAFGKNSGGFSPYVELNWIHNTETYGVTMSNVTVEQVGAEDQGEVRAGADWRINDAFTVWGHFGVTSGSDGYSNREGSLGVRYTF